MNTPAKRSHRTRLRAGLVALCCWVGLVILFATQNIVLISFPWDDALIHAGTFWLVWAVLMPAVVWLSIKFPLQRERMLLNVLIHFGAIAFVVAANQVAYRNFIEMPRSPRTMAEVKLRDQQIREGQTPPPERSSSNRFVGFRAGFDILIYLGAFAVCQAVANFRRSQLREKQAAELTASLAQAKLQALRMQINPHFLFNALNAISTLVHKDPDAADDMISDLSDFLRSTLESGREQEVSLRQELEFVKRYLAIEQRRFGERLQVEWNIPDTLLNALVPALILQPLVENAIKHGIEPGRGQGTIVVQAARNGELLELVVHDSGSGPNLQDAQTAGHGIGLSNTRARLKELYGSKQSFAFSKIDGGSVVSVRVPYHEEPIVPSAFPVPTNS